MIIGCATAGGTHDAYSPYTDLAVMQVPKHIRPPTDATPAGAVAARGLPRALPDDVLREASARLGIMSLVAAGLWVVGTILGQARHAVDAAWRVDGTRLDDRRCDRGRERAGVAPAFCLYADRQSGPTANPGSWSGLHGSHSPCAGTDVSFGIDPPDLYPSLHRSRGSARSS